MKYLQVSNKKGISAIVAYSLLIAMTIALSVLVFNWLRYYVEDTGESGAKCPEGVSLIITQADCSSGTTGNLNLTVKNKGRHNIDGFVVRVNDKPGSELGFYTYNESGAPLKIGEESNNFYEFSSMDESLTNITLVEAQPFVTEGGENIYCSVNDIVKPECS
jgi:flagellin-like protein